MNLELANKIALVTGSSMGIGLAVAQGLAKEGAHLVLCARDEALIKEKAAELAAVYGVKAIGISADLTQAASIEHLLKETETVFGGLDILISNAGIGSNETILNASDERWQYYWDLHLMASVRLARGVTPLMRQRGGGVILHNASICAKQPLGHEPIYNVTKAALMMFSKCLANELISDNIRVNCINPGLIQTVAWEAYAQKQSADTDQTWQQYLESVAKQYAPIGRFASPEELADFMIFLCSPRSSYCVGSSYYVDGGWLNSVA
ncbi:MAG: SDR family NAD(P)-dependent oxidoreductase [Bacteroidales bacterium]